LFLLLLLCCALMALLAESVSATQLFFFTVSYFWQVGFVGYSSVSCLELWNVNGWYNSGFPVSQHILSRFSFRRSLELDYVTSPIPFMNNILMKLPPPLLPNTVLYRPENVINGLHSLFD
jgi:hypothetical protein